MQLIFSSFRRFAKRNILLLLQSHLLTKPLTNILLPSNVEYINYILFMSMKLLPHKKTDGASYFELDFFVNIPALRIIESSRNRKILI